MPTNILHLYLFIYFYSQGIEECTDSTGMSWRLVHNDSHPTGHSQLMIKLNKVPPYFFSA